MTHIKRDLALLAVSLLVLAGWTIAHIPGWLA